MAGRRVTALAVGVALVALLPVPRVHALSYQNASSGLPPTHQWDCNPVLLEQCNNPLDSGGWSGVAMGDVDGDGLDDVGAVGRLLYGFHVWLSDGAGSWTESSSGLDTGCHGRTDVAFARVDGSGTLDFGGIAGINGTPAAFAGDGAGSFAACSAGLVAGGGEGFAFGDFNGDGDRDIGTAGHFSGGVHAHLGDGACNFVEASAGLPVDGGGHKAAAADFDGDGRDELVDTLFSVSAPLVQGVHVWRYDIGAASWSLFASWYFDQPYGVASADFDQNGLVDLAVAVAQDDVGTAGSVRVFLSAGDGTFTESSTGLPVLDAFYGDVAAGDLDNDGAPDLVAGTWTGDVRAFLNDGAASFSEATGTGLPTGQDNIEGLDLGDLDGDCRLDLAYAAYTCGVQVYRQADPVPCPIRAEAGAARTICTGQNVGLDASASRACGCLGTTMFRWWAGATLEQDWTADPMLVRSPLATTLYRVDAACSASLGCFVSDTVLVTVADGSICGDGCCGAGEDECACGTDCGADACGNGCCGPVEDCLSCAADCGACPDLGPPDVMPDPAIDLEPDARPPDAPIGTDAAPDVAADAAVPDAPAPDVPADIGADAAAPDAAAPDAPPSDSPVPSRDATTDVAGPTPGSAPDACGCRLGAAGDAAPGLSLTALWLLATVRRRAVGRVVACGRTVFLTSSDHTRILFSMAKVLKKVTVNLPPDILDGACRFTGKGITPTIIQGLLELERRAKRSALRGLRGKVRFELDLDATRR